MPPESVCAVFFDLGGTLFSYRDAQGLLGPIFAEAIARLGVDAEAAQIGAAYLRALAEADRCYADRDYYRHRDLFHDTYREFMREIGASPEDDFYEWLYATQRRAMVEDVPLREDCLATLGELRARGYSLSIVSNIDDDYLLPMVRNFGLEPHLDHWSSSEEAGSCKPHPGIFELALEKAGCRPEEVVFVGDSRRHDVRGSREMGMTSVLIDEGAGPSPLDSGDETAPHHVIGELRELLDLLSPRR